ncbi:hypothetical protein ACH5RR_039917 [Cinchona calisaya]|uniref:PGG domain-containing protein n=1 Tax=Cinchona calisaya TaxID=153742 RepID=A0ABD2Y4V9_9GENT
MQTIKYLVRRKKQLKLRVNSKNANGKTAKDHLLAQGGNKSRIVRSLKDSGAHTGAVVRSGDRREWLEKSKNTIMVVASLIATMAFQTVVSPPRGVWQDETTQGHKIGEAVMAQTHRKYYRHLIRANTVAFVSSLSTILTLISMTTTFVSLYTFLTWLAVTAIAISYAISLVAVGPKDTSGQLSDASEKVVENIRPKDSATS